MKELYEARKWLNLTQAELGRHAGLTATSISLYECGHRYPSVDSLKSLASALDISIESLMERSKNPWGHIEIPNELQPMADWLMENPTQVEKLWLVFLFLQRRSQDGRKTRETLA